MKIDDGGPMYPHTVEELFRGELIPMHHPGLTIRDWFAGQALVGWLSDGGEDRERAAEVCYQFADAMLAERKERR